MTSFNPSSAPKIPSPINVRGADCSNGVGTSPVLLFHQVNGYRRMYERKCCCKPHDCVQRSIVVVLGQDSPMVGILFRFAQTVRRHHLGQASPSSLCCCSERTLLSWKTRNRVRPWSIKQTTLIPMMSHNAAFIRGLDSTEERGIIVSNSALIGSSCLVGGGLLNGLVLEMPPENGI